jgi:hypothetical protein
MATLDVIKITHLSNSLKGLMQHWMSNTKTKAKT